MLKPVFCPETVLLFVTPELEIHLDHFAESFLDLWLLEPRSKTVESELWQGLSVFGIQLDGVRRLQSSNEAPGARPYLFVHGPDSIVVFAHVVGRLEPYTPYRDFIFLG